MEKFDWKKARTEIESGIQDIVELERMGFTEDRDRDCYIETDKPNNGRIKNSYVRKAEGDLPEIRLTIFSGHFEGRSVVLSSRPENNIFHFYTLRPIPDDQVLPTIQDYLAAVTSGKKYQPELNKE